MTDKSKIALEIAELEKQFIESNFDPGVRNGIESKIIKIILKHNAGCLDLMELDDMIQEILEK